MRIVAEETHRTRTEKSCKNQDKSAKFDTNNHEDTEVAQKTAPDVQFHWFLLYVEVPGGAKIDNFSKILHADFHAFFGMRKKRKKCVKKIRKAPARRNARAPRQGIIQE